MRIVLLVLCLALAGCGGGGGSSAPALPTSATMRAPSVGNQVVYNVTGTATDGTRTDSIAGTARLTAYSGTLAPVYGGTPYRIHYEFQVSGPGFNYANAWYEMFERDGLGNSYFVGTTEGGNSRVTSSSEQPIMMPALISVGQAWAFDVTYNTGNLVRFAYQVLSADRVAGFTAFRIHSTMSDTGSTTIRDTWYVPEWGCPVREERQINAGGSRANMTMAFASKNF